MTSTSDTYAAVIGTSTDGGQVHLAHGTDPAFMSQLCRFGRSTEYLTKIIATLPGGGRDETLDVLLEHMIPMSRLCKNCFPIKTREAYRRRIRAAAEQAAAEDAEQAEHNQKPATESQPASAPDLDHLEFGKAHLISPTGKRYAVVDGDDDGDERGGYLWLVPVDADGIRTGGRRRRLYDTQASGWTEATEPAADNARAVPDPADEADKEEDEPESARLTADVVLFGEDEHGTVHVLMIRRRWDPHAGAFALPGGHVNQGEPVSTTAFRELAEETGIRPGILAFVAFYDDPARDPRGRYVTFAYTTTVSGLPQPTAGDDAAEALWLDVDDVLMGRYPIAFDHARIIGDAARRAIVPA